MSISSLSPVTALLLADTREYSAKMDEAQGKMEAFGKTSGSAGQKLGDMWSKMSTVVVGAAAGVVAVAVDMAYKYNEALDTMQRSTNLTDAQMKLLQGSILKVSTATATSATLITTGMTQLIKSGESTKQSLTDVTQAAKYAQATHADLNTTLTAAIGIQRMHISGTKNMTQTLNIFDTAVKNSQLTSDNLTSALSGKALSAFSAYHIDLKTATTMLAGFADQNLVGTRATMVLKTGIAALEKPAVSSTGKLSIQALALAKVGLNMTTVAGEVRKPGGMLQVMQQLSTAFDHNASSAMKAQGMAAWMQQIFGTSAGPAFTNMIAELPKLQTLYQKMNTSGGAVNSSFTEWIKSPAGAVAKFKTVLENSAIRLGDVLLPKLTIGLIDVTKIVTGILSSPTKTSVVEDAAAVLIAGSLATKAAGIGVSIAEGFGVSVAGGLASVIGASIGAGVLAYVVGHPGASEFTKAQNEWHKNKVVGAVDVAALTGNTFINLFNDVIKHLPGKPEVPQLPVFGPNTPTINTSIPGVNNASRLGPATKPKAKVTINHIKKVSFGM